jgi:hypothetical protein
MGLEKFNVKENHNFFWKIHGYSLVHLVLCSPTYLPTYVNK